MRIDKTVIMHISDLHFGMEKKFPEFTGYRNEVFKKFIDSHENLINNPGYAPDILVISGDIAFDGSETDYNEAKVFFEKFFAIPNNPIMRENVVVCFGNHDMEDRHIGFDATDSSWTDYTVHKRLFRPEPDTDFNTFYSQTTNEAGSYGLDILNRYHRFTNAENFCSSMGFVPLTNNDGKYKYAYGYREDINGIDFISLNTEWDFWGRTDNKAKVDFGLYPSWYTQLSNFL